MNRTSVVAVRSRNAGSTGRGVMLFGALPTESNLVFSRLQGERRRIGSKGAFVTRLLLMFKQVTNVSLATGDEHARSHTRHRWPVCYCYQVVKELRTLRPCAGPLNCTKQKGPDACAIRAFGPSNGGSAMRLHLRPDRVCSYRDSVAAYARTLPRPLSRKKARAGTPRQIAVAN
jgi:hypothetical protein